MTVYTLRRLIAIIPLGLLVGAAIAWWESAGRPQKATDVGLLVISLAVLFGGLALNDRRRP